MNETTSTFRKQLILQECIEENYNPYKPLTREEIIDSLEAARRHAGEGKVIPAHQASEKVREKYGL